MKILKQGSKDRVHGPNPVGLGRSGSVLARFSRQNLDWIGPRPRIFFKSRTDSDRSVSRLSGPLISVRKVSQPNGSQRIFWLGYFVWLNRFFPVHSGSFEQTNKDCIVVASGASSFADLQTQPFRFETEWPLLAKFWHGSFSQFVPRKSFRSRFSDIFGAIFWIHFRPLGGCDCRSA